MLPILLYLLKANAALLLFAAAYFGLLRRLTFFTLNRVYLLFSLLFAAVYPALPVPALLPAEATSTVAFTVVAAATTAATLPVAAAPSIDWAMVGVALYAAGVAVMLVRLLVQLLSLARLRARSRPAMVQGQAVRVLAGEISPFSFGQTIYLNPEQHPGPELAAVLRHELVHVRQWHTVDVLLAQLMQAAAWCNPAAWLLRRAVLDNLEYMADHAVLAAGLDRRAYQYSLLRLSHAPAGPSLVSSFTFPTLKNRVVMMNTPLSSSGKLARYILAGPLALAVALGAAGARAQGTGPVVPKAKIVTAQPAPAAIHVAEDGPATAHTAIAAQQKSQPLKPAQNPVMPATRAPSTVRLDGKPTGPPPVYYVDGKVNSDAIHSINPQDIASINVFKGEQARRLAGEDGAGGIVVITTKQNLEQPEVQAFNEKMGITAAAPAQAAPTAVPYLAAPALAYITAHYPDARLVEMTAVKPDGGGPAQYKALLAIGRRPLAVLFDERGQFISEVPSTR